MPRHRTLRLLAEYLHWFRQALSNAAILSFLICLIGTLAIQIYTGEPAGVLWERPEFIFSTVTFGCLASCATLLFIAQPVIDHLHKRMLKERHQLSPDEFGKLYFPLHQRKTAIKVFTILKRQVPFTKGRILPDDHLSIDLDIDIINSPLLWEELKVTNIAHPDESFGQKFLDTCQSIKTVRDLVEYANSCSMQD